MKQCDKCNKKSDLYLYFQNFGKNINDSRYQHISNSKRRVIEKVEMLCQECLQKNSQKLPLYLKKQFKINLDNKFIDELRQKELKIRDLTEKVDCPSLKKAFEKFKVYDLNFNQKLEIFIKEEFDQQVMKLKQNFNKTVKDIKIRNQSLINIKTSYEEINQKFINNGLIDIGKFQEAFDDNFNKTQARETIKNYHTINSYLTTIRFYINNQDAQVNPND
ncbi:hypothetical protein OXYTRIMIC_529 [Oxytricha trifallax]|uniref:Uncharacterized protein n=1 Tax=Oxytricha trifallax TaxID=1172189 RepID=A0A073HXX5_9SPIT|nr:hypothetical protein OXYTRIMIC_529 [Oxytricha trifallax]